MRNSITLSDLVPIGIVLLVAAIAALAAYVAQRRATPDRTRDAMAYQLGFLAGLAATLCLATVLALFLTADTPAAQAGVLASFFAPFAGMIHAELCALAEEEPASYSMPSTTLSAVDRSSPTDLKPK